MIVWILGLGACSVLLTGCMTTGPASVAGGECRIFERPPYAVRGLRPYDQDWIDGNIEAGVGGCGWERPKARPAALDAVPGQKAAPPPAKKRGLIKRIKDRVVHPFTAPVAPVIESPPPIVATPTPPRDPVDDLLQPGEPIRRVH